MINGGNMAVPELRTTVAIVGGGIAGTWVGLKLARAGVPTTLVTYSARNRGGIQGATGRSVGAVNTAPISRDDFREFMEQLGQGQQHPSVIDTMLRFLKEELNELQSLGDFKPINLGIALASGNTAAFMENMQRMFLEAGGVILDAWVTRLVADELGCAGLQFEKNGMPGKLLANAVVIASGGYAGLFDGSVKTPAYGTMLGHYLRAGGIASNLEFIFKHGYGKPDLGALTPTEELPGAEIYDSDGLHVAWLERELFEGRGTANHLQAFKHWRRNKEKDFYIDLTYRDLFHKLNAINKTLAGADAPNVNLVRGILDEVGAYCEGENVEKARQLVERSIVTHGKVTFESFNDLKTLCPRLSRGEIFRVRQIAYFSMGGIAHIAFSTNLANVFVSGEAMHDFGAHRVGGLPWGLYLVSGRVVSERLIRAWRSGEFDARPSFDIIPGKATFRGDVLQDIRIKMHRYQEEDFSLDNARDCVAWIRDLRRRLCDEGEDLSDSISWLVVAEAIMSSTVLREESRGCFYRPDFPGESEVAGDHFSCSFYDAKKDEVVAELIKRDELVDKISPNAQGVYQDVIG